MSFLSKFSSIPDYESKLAKWWLVLGGAWVAWGIYISFFARSSAKELSFGFVFSFMYRMMFIFSELMRGIQSVQGFLVFGVALLCVMIAYSIVCQKRWSRPLLWVVSLFFIIFLGPSMVIMLPQMVILFLGALKAVFAGGRSSYGNAVMVSALGTLHLACIIIGYYSIKKKKPCLLEEDPAEAKIYDARYKAREHGWGFRIITPVVALAILWQLFYWLYGGIPLFFNTIVIFDWFYKVSWVVAIVFYIAAIFAFDRYKYKKFFFPPSALSYIAMSFVFILVLLSTSLFPRDPYLSKIYTEDYLKVKNIMEERIERRHRLSRGSIFPEMLPPGANNILVAARYGAMQGGDSFALCYAVTDGYSSHVDEVFGRLKKVSPEKIRVKTDENEIYGDFPFLRSDTFWADIGDVGSCKNWRCLPDIAYEDRDGSYRVAVAGYSEHNRVCYSYSHWK